MMDNKNDSSDSMYEQLQESLDEFVSLWYFCKLVDWIISHPNIVVSIEGIVISDVGWSWPFYFSYHDLFSKDSGLMEFVEWEVWKDKRWNLKEICINPDIVWCIADISYRQTETPYHYMMMWPMTAEEKVSYFLENIIDG